MDPEENESEARGISSNNQVVGASYSCPDASISRAVLWDKGSIIDLNTAIAGTPSLQLGEARYINDRGEIAGRGLPPGCGEDDDCGHVFLLIPCDPTAGQDCSTVTAKESNVAASKKQSTPRILQRMAPGKAPTNWRQLLARRTHLKTSEN